MAIWHRGRQWSKFPDFFGTILCTTARDLFYPRLWNDVYFVFILLNCGHALHLRSGTVAVHKHMNTIWMINGDHIIPGRMLLKYPNIFLTVEEIPRKKFNQKFDPARDQTRGREMRGKDDYGMRWWWSISTVPGPPPISPLIIINHWYALLLLWSTKPPLATRVQSSRLVLITQVLAKVQARIKGSTPNGKDRIIIDHSPAADKVHAHMWQPTSILYIVMKIV